MDALIGQKKIQSQKFLEDGTRIPVTQIWTGTGNTVVANKTTDKDGYNAFQIGFGSKKKANKAELGHAKKASQNEASAFLREVKTSADLEFNLGQIIKPTEVFTPGDIVDVTGVSKGKGYAGVVKRHHFKGGPKTHGQSDRHRAPGAIGQGTTPGRVYRGKRMAGRMGHEQVTVKNLQVVEVGEDYILIKGLVPGGVNSLIMVKKVGQNKKFVPLYKENVEESTQKSAESVSHVSDAAQPVEENQSQDSASLSDNQAPIENIEVHEESAPIANTSENENASVPSEEEVKKNAS